MTYKCSRQEDGFLRVVGDRGEQIEVGSTEEAFVIATYIIAEEKETEKNSEPK